MSDVIARRTSCRPRCPSTPRGRSTELGEFTVTFRLDTRGLCDGSRWHEIHHDELVANWARVQVPDVPQQIEPLP